MIARSLVRSASAAEGQASRGKQARSVMSSRYVTLIATVLPRPMTRYNMPAQFDVTCTMPNGLPLQLVTGQRQGILFEGDEGRFFANRGGIYGIPVDQLKERPLPEDAITKLKANAQQAREQRKGFEIGV